MSTQTKQHTPGAVRAATIIVSNIATYNELRDIEIMSPPVDMVAECIDRETCIPELLEACEAVLADCQNINSDSRLSLEVGKQLRTAIAKAVGDK